MKPPALVSGEMGSETARRPGEISADMKPAFSKLTSLPEVTGSPSRSGARAMVPA
jgi:hypothetical protein